MRPAAFDTDTYSKDVCRALMDDVTQVAVVATDVNGTIVAWNPGAERLFGHTACDAVGRDLFRLLQPRPAGVPPGTAGGLEQALAQYRDAGSGEQEWVCSTAAGLPVHAMVHVVPLTDPNGTLAGYVGIHRDVSGQREVERYIAHMRTFNGRLAPDGRIEQCADSVLQASGLSRADVLGIALWDTPWFSFDRQVSASVRRRVLEAAADGTPVHWEEDARLGDASARVLVSVTPVRDAMGRVEYLIAEGTDITELVRARSRATRLAYHDPLTALGNRRLLVEHLGRTMAAARRRGEAVGLLLIDLDDFKPINDMLGHAVGDRVLKRMAKRLRAVARESDLVVRLGGDEFVIVVGDLRGTDDQQVARLRALAARVAETLSRPMRYGERLVGLTGSIGLARAPRDGATPGALLASADRAMYQAKEDGKGRWCFLDSDRARVERQRFLITGALRTALAHRELTCYLQPVVDTVTGAVVGAEALVRWHHRAHGWVSPGEFIPVAEASGLVSAVNWQVLEQVVSGLAHWSGSHPLACLKRISVNISVADLMDTAFPGRVGRLLARHNVPPDRLILELTEHMLVNDRERVRGQMQQLKAVGVQIALDDFGTGYSSLGYLKFLPIDAVKIDRSFVQGLGRDSRDERIVRAIISLARGLELRLVAEGVETAAQAGWLKQHGCARVQGFLFARPMPAAELEGWCVGRPGARGQNHPPPQLSAHLPGFPHAPAPSCLGGRPALGAGQQVEQH